MDGAVVVLSGGQDSTLCLYWAMERFDPIIAITFDYGQSHLVEVAAAQQIAKWANADHYIIEVRDCLKSWSPLTDGSQPLETYSDFKEMSDIIGDRIEFTFVPLRNTLFLTIAANRAVYHGCKDLVTGVCQEDNANYPDCTRRFIDSMQWTVNESLGWIQSPPKFHIHTPLMHLSKAQSVREALKYRGCYAALAYSHTAYSGEFPPVTQDHATVLRAHGFEEAGYPDPLIVRAYWLDKLDELPNTPNYEDFSAQLIKPNYAGDRDLYHKLYNLERYFRSTL
jgi:7-cyano-7-deazaguanine synthase